MSGASNDTLSSDSWTGGSAREGDGEGQEIDDLKAALHGLDVTVWLMIFCIFTFFFILCVATLCMHWLARRKLGLGEVVMVPLGRVPGYITVAVLPGDPHIRLLAHYSSHLTKSYSTLNELPRVTAPRTLSAPDLYTPCCRPATTKMKPR